MASPPRIFHQLAVRAVILAAVPAAVVLWAVGPVAALIAGGAVSAVELARVRSVLRSGIPETLDFVPSRPADHPWLDADGFRRELGELDALDFAPTADYTITYPSAPTGLARVLVHPKLCIYAEVNQVRDKGKITPTTTCLTSMMENGWSLQTSSQEPLAVAVAFMQAKRSAWRSLPGAPVAELLADHLALRDRMCADLGLRLSGDGSVERYFELQQTGHHARRQALLHTNIVAGIARAIAAERRPARQWFGEYSPR